MRLVRDGQTLAPDRYTKTARLQSRTVDDLIDAGRVYHHFANGATIVLQALHRYWRPLAYFCRDLELSLTHPVQVNVYLTPPSSRGLDIHYDTHDVFVMQVSGVKHWQVWGRALDLPLSHQRRKDKYIEPGTPDIDIELKPGDCLYIPRGFLHAAETAASESSHMTVGILAYTWMDVVRAAVDRAVDDVFLREALPPGFARSPGEIGEQASAKLAELADRMRSLDPGPLIERVADRFWSRRTPVLTGQLQQVLSLDALDDASVVRRRAGATARLVRTDDGAMLVLGDRRLVMPAWVEPALAQVLESAQLHVHELSRHLDATGRLVLVRRLILEGLLEQAHRD